MIPAIVRARVRPAARIAKRRVRSALWRLGVGEPRDQWILGLRHRGSRRFDEPGGFVPVLPPDDRFYADPFLISDGAHRYVFLEEYIYARARGIISVMSIDEAGDTSTTTPVLQRPYHLSYPFVFTDGADYFLIPETGSNQTVELYRALEFPSRWRLERILLEGVRARDTTLFADNDRYWLFTCLDSPAGKHKELSLFSADSLDGAWLPHPKNPVVADVRFGRPAGRLFWHDGELIRPAQDCSETYGRAVNFRKVIDLTRHEYREVSAGRLEPVWRSELAGTHTYNADEKFEVIDGLRLLPNPRKRGRVWTDAPLRETSGRGGSNRFDT
jgi:hypothetical protein